MDCEYAGGRNKRLMAWVNWFVILMMCKGVDSFEHWNKTALGQNRAPMMVGLTLIRGAAAKGAVCLDGTLPAYHIHRGYGSGANTWLIQLEGGGWCNSIRNCLYHKRTHHCSSNYMEKQIPFEGILSNKAQENPDFYNWNRVKVRYCDGASFRLLTGILAVDMETRYCILRRAGYMCQAQCPLAHRLTCTFF